MPEHAPYSRLAHATENVCGVHGELENRLAHKTHPQNIVLFKSEHGKPAVFCHKDRAPDNEAYTAIPHVKLCTHTHTIQIYPYYSAHCLYVFRASS